MDHERHLGRSNQRSTYPPSSFSRSVPKHICSLCGKPLSSRYHESHPLVCSRPKCAKTIQDVLLWSPCGVIIYEIHHHCPPFLSLKDLRQLIPPLSYTGRALGRPSRIARNTPPSTKQRSRKLSSIQEESVGRPPGNCRTDVGRPTPSTDGVR
jgi:hypothetical protein